MCGRFTVTCAADEIRAEFGIDVPDDWVPRYNIAPQQPIPIIGRNEAGEQRFGLVQWGLVPWWSEDASSGPRSINARAETLLDKPMFRDPFLLRRCLVIADGFYEWSGEGRVRQPWRFHMADDRVFAFAGLWDRWTRPDGEPLFTATIVTTDASPSVARVHDRMPVILGRHDRDAWLDPDADPDALNGLLRPYAGADLIRDAVSPAVNRVANEGPQLILPTDAQNGLFD